MPNQSSKIELSYVFKNHYRHYNQSICESVTGSHDTLQRNISLAFFTVKWWAGLLPIQQMKITKYEQWITETE